MNITKIGHCCLLIETNGRRILTDPGVFTAEEHVLDTIDLIIITHEHGDHIHVESLQLLLQQNPNAQVVTNSGVGELLDAAGITYEVLEGTATAEFLGIALEACDATHAEIFEDYNLVQNTGYFINKRLFYPGDAYAQPNKPIDILALPAGGPWCRTTDTLHYALKVRPKVAFPVHDAIERADRVHIIHGTLGKILTENEIAFIPLKAGESHDFT